MRRDAMEIAKGQFIRLSMLAGMLDHFRDPDADFIKNLEKG